MLNVPYYKNTNFNHGVSNNVLLYWEKVISCCQQWLTFEFMSHPGGTVGRRVGASFIPHDVTAASP